jgi:hypothetical protein
MVCSSILPIINRHTDLRETSHKFSLRPQANPVPENHSCITELLFPHLSCILITQTLSSSVIQPSIEYQHSVRLQKDFFDDLSILKTFADFHASASTSFMKASNNVILQALNDDNILCRNNENTLQLLNTA